MITLTKITLTILWICVVVFLVGWIAYEISYCNWLYSQRHDTPYRDYKNNSGRSENDPVSIWNKHKRR